MDKIVCLGKNYRDHALEMGGPPPGKPVLFLKPPSSALWVARFEDTVEAPVPVDRGAVHHECEIVLRLARGGFRLGRDEARGAIDAVTLGLDMTLRDVQADLKKNGHPWEAAKVFDGSAIVGPWLTGDEIEPAIARAFAFELDGQVRQRGRADQMTLDWIECVVHASESFRLLPGDLVFTGTPAGVGPVLKGQRGSLTWGDRRLFSVLWT